jgi:hypothetical protein
LHIHYGSPAMPLSCRSSVRIPLPYLCTNTKGRAETRPDVVNPVSIVQLKGVHEKPMMIRIRIELMMFPPDHNADRYKSAGGDLVSGWLPTFDNIIIYCCWLHYTPRFVRVQNLMFFPPFSTQLKPLQLLRLGVICFVLGVKGGCFWNHIYKSLLIYFLSIKKVPPFPPRDLNPLKFQRKKGWMYFHPVPPFCWCKAVFPVIRMVFPLGQV